MRPPPNLQIIMDVPTVKLCVQQGNEKFKSLREKIPCSHLGVSQTHEQITFPHLAAPLCVWGFAVDLLRVGKLGTISWVLFPLQVHGLYRTTGASFEKAQQEFATGVMSNKTVQTAAANAASTAATSAAQNAFKGNRM